MTERATNERRHWKGIVFPFDHFFGDDTQECLYCLTEYQAELLRGLLEPVGWKTRWWSDTQEIDGSWIVEYRDDMIRRLMMSCCGGEFEIRFQWTEDGVLQQSDDDGATWTDVPQEDPRNSSPIFPPVPGEPSDDKKCLAANSIRDLIKEQVGDQLTDDMSRYTLGQLIHDWVTTVIQTSNPFEALIQIVTNQILALVIATLRPALTDEVYDKLACCMIDNMADDLSFDDDQWEGVRECISTDITGIAGVFLEHLVFLLGKVGLTNLARSQASTDDTCGCEGCASLFSVELGTEIDRGDNYITVDAFLNTDGVWYCVVSSGDQDVCCNISWNNDFFLNYGYKACGSSSLTVNSGDPATGFNAWYAIKTRGTSHIVTFTFS